VVEQAAALMLVLMLFCVLQERMHGIDSKCRSRSPEETLTIFKEMQQGTERGLTNCLRFKLDMQNPNKALRDPVAFRCNLTPHWRTGEKYKVTLRTVLSAMVTSISNKDV
jgi:glutamyl/glutaminyl-tRNA synthetase